MDEKFVVFMIMFYLATVVLSIFGMIFAWPVQWAYVVVACQMLGLVAVILRRV